MKKLYVYTDNRAKEHLLSVFALTILEADALFKEKTGIDASRCPHIGCQIINPDQHFWAEQIKSQVKGKS